MAEQFDAIREELGSSEVNWQEVAQTASAYFRGMQEAIKLGVAVDTSNMLLAQQGALLEQMIALVGRDIASLRKDVVAIAKRISPP